MGNFIISIPILDLYYPWYLFTALDLQRNSSNYSILGYNVDITPCPIILLLFRAIVVFGGVNSIFHMYDMWLGQNQPLVCEFGFNSLMWTPA